MIKVLVCALIVGIFGFAWFFIEWITEDIHD
jgi:hypothetical protein